jgi:hypothetical protein
MTPLEDTWEVTPGGHSGIWFGVLEGVLQGCPQRCPPGMYSKVSSGRVLWDVPPGVSSGGVLHGVLWGNPPGPGVSSLGVFQRVLHGVLQVSSREDTLPILFIYQNLYSLVYRRDTFVSNGSAVFLASLSKQYIYC